MKTTTMTLFARYKNMINTMYNKGFRKYTANELNTFVGVYENSTRWKSMNNNPYYTTRTYQTALKQLGCITMIKRGLWEINGPIPEWFGSFHINALLNAGSRRELEKSSFYWQELRESHKVNPWKAKQNTTNNHSTVAGLTVLSEELLLITMDLHYQITADNKVQHIGETYNLQIPGRPDTITTIQESLACMICKSHDVDLDDVVALQGLHAQKTILKNLEGAKAKEERSYTKEDIQNILQVFGDELQSKLTETLTDAIADFEIPTIYPVGGRRDNK
jgi:hypothetical protein